MRTHFFNTFSNSRDFFKKCFLTLFFSGLSPKAPGTFGTLVALPFAWAISHYIAPSTLLLLALLISVIAVKVINDYEKEGMEHDCSEIVIDELAGVWISVAMIGSHLFGIALSFVLFRLFDIWKPSVIGRIDREVKGGWGVMGDDLLAGFFAGLLGLMIIGGIQRIESLAFLLEF
ncbi:MULTISPECIES: phosphatidylglycerophosphatase A [Helicobacter]|uniref:Phosphatidylglycerophosphatase A n=4 Tax=Helicobacter TaxID=209 RepID=A0A3D8I9E0_9HELI|nr:MULTISPECIES: phosphatidylglycerophosphatase A [Helicobacter]RDU61783.1 phosphatidylglycerophosphatase A [Helicobacter ganmani]